MIIECTAAANCVNVLFILTDGNPIHYQNLGQSIEDNSSEDRQSPRLLCLKPGCENLQFSTEVSDLLAMALSFMCMSFDKFDE